MKKTISKELLFILALVGNSISFNLLLKANFGLACMSSLTYVLQLVFSKISIGMINFIVQSISLIIMMCITRKPSIYYCLSFIVGFVFGLLTDLFGLIFAYLPINLPLRIIYFILGWYLLVNTLVWFMYCDMPLMPFDIFVRDIAAQKKLNPGRVKRIADIVFASLAIIISLTCFHKLKGVGLSTIFQALFTGKFEVFLINKFLSKYEPKIYTNIGKTFSKFKVI